MIDADGQKNLPMAPHCFGQDSFPVDTIEATHLHNRQAFIQTGAVIRMDSLKGKKRSWNNRDTSGCGKISTLSSVRYTS